MVGKADMTLHGWRQLIEWSLQHSCMEDSLRAEAERRWEGLWDKFLDAVIDEFESVLDWKPES
jgi:adenosine deaminase CECR1